MFGSAIEKEMYEKLDDPIEPSPVNTFIVTVVDKENRILHYGYKTPTHRVAFFVSFQLENGKIKTYEVDERSFRRLKKGSKGELAVSDGKFVGFSRSR